MKGNFRDLLIRSRRDGWTRIYETHSLYHALHYVLLFPYGQRGWHPLLPRICRTMDDPPVQRQRVDKNHMTLRQYTRYCLFERPQDSDHIFRAGTLAQEFWVDCWAADEQSNLMYMRNSQDKFRVDLYQNLVDHLAVDGAATAEDVGRRTILPSSFTGGPRFMAQNCQDALAINRHFGGADLFLTATANPNWPEVIAALKPGQTPADRPDLVAHAFHLHMKSLKKDLANGVLGVVVAHVYTIEFQKRGLPHMHMIIFLAQQSKLRTPDMINSLISAELPDSALHPELFNLVTSLMIHGPCGAQNPNAPCMDPVTKKCSKSFPKPFCEQTTVTDNSYTIYRRQDNRRVHQVRGKDVDNCWVVPHCPYFLARYGCHINLECIASIKALKYIYKYVYKGFDCAVAGIQRDSDEVTLYEDSRYISAPEAIWRTMKFEIHGRDPPVTCLSIHVEDEHTVFLCEGELLADVVDCGVAQRTQLKAFFEVNSSPDPAVRALAAPLLYQEFPQQFTWKEKEKVWVPRQRMRAIGRMYHCSPASGPLFYLRLLLTHVHGPKSFEDIHTYEGVTYPTYREACMARGLLEDDREWEQCLREAKDMATGHQLRQLFSVILCQCFPTRPEHLWDTFKHHLCDDLSHLLHRLQPDRMFGEDDHLDYGLYLINQLLDQNQKSLVDFPPMPTPQMPWAQILGNHLIMEQRAFDPVEQTAQAWDYEGQLNEGQRAAYDAVVNSVLNNQPRVFFLTGSGGTGKTFVYKAMAARIRGESQIVLCVASSGIAALLLPGGRTAHSCFKIPIDIHESSTCSISVQSPTAELLRATKLIIWDEAPMQHCFAAEAVDRTLRDVMKSRIPFGGITMVFRGDFKQILPVIPKGSRAQIVEASLCKSYLWDFIQILRLEQNMRIQAIHDPRELEFATWQLEVGEGRHTTPNGDITIPAWLHCPQNNVQSLVQRVYPGVFSIPPPPGPYFKKHSILSARNDDVDAMNATLLESFHGVARVYESADVLVEDGEGGLPVSTEVLNAVNASGLPLHTLKLKVGAPVMVLRNLDQKAGICNGTRGLVTKMGARVVEIKLLDSEQTAFIPRMKIIPSDPAIPFKFSRHQFPLRLAFSMTINKSQGQSLEHVGLDLRSAVFTHGQFYVGVSRATSVQRIHAIWGVEGPAVTKNIVFPEVFNRL